MVDLKRVLLAVCVALVLLCVALGLYLYGYTNKVVKVREYCFAHNMKFEQVTGGDMYCINDKGQRVVPAID